MQEQQTVEVIYGINPVKEALRAGMPIERAYTCKAQGAVLPLIGQLKAMKVPILEVDEKRMSFLCPKEEGRTPNHQGIVIQLSAAAYVEVEDLLRVAARKGEDPLIIVLDGITDPHNMGAIMRSAEALGAHGIIIPKRRSAGLSATAFRASSGAAAHIGVARVTNLAATLDQLKEYGLWVAGTAAGRAGLQPGELKRRLGPLHRQRRGWAGAFDRTEMRFYGGHSAEGEDGIAERFVRGHGVDL